MGALQAPRPAAARNISQHLSQSRGRPQNRRETPTTGGENTGRKHRDGVLSCDRPDRSGCSTGGQLVLELKDK